MRYIRALLNWSAEPLLTVAVLLILWAAFWIGTGIVFGVAKQAFCLFGPCG